MHRCTECREPCDCQEVLIGGCIHCYPCDDLIGDEMEDYEDEDDEE